MKAEERDLLERDIDQACNAGDLQRAATLAIRGYGPEVLGFLLALHHDEALVQEAYAQLCEDLWRGLPRFSRRSSLRTWLYTLARHALSRSRRGEQRRARRSAPLSHWEGAAEEVRSQTLPYLRTAVKDRFAQLRESLPVEDQALLILRVDRQLEWGELAQVLSERPDLGGEELKREAARLRQRFRLVKQRLRELADREGLLGPADG